MKLKPLVAFTLFALPISLLAEIPAATPDPQMELFIKASTPGKEHQLLQSYVGKWNHTVTSWHKPDAPPQVSKGTSDIESMFSGRFIKHKVAGSMMGQPFEGLGITGFDNVQKHYSTVWLDSFGTGIMAGKGEFDSNQNAIVDRGTFSCPLTPTGTATYRAVWTAPKNNSFKYEMFSTDDKGKEFRMMEIVYSKIS